MNMELAIGLGVVTAWVVKKLSKNGNRNYHKVLSPAAVVLSVASVRYIGGHFDPVEVALVAPAVSGWHGWAKNGWQWLRA